MNKVVRVEPGEGYLLNVWFRDGKHGTFDVEPYLDIGVFRQLRDVSIFRSAKVEYGTVVWPGEIDLAPDTIEADLTEALFP